MRCPLCIHSTLASTLPAQSKSQQEPHGGFLPTLAMVLSCQRNRPACSQALTWKVLLMMLQKSRLASPQAQQQQRGLLATAAHLPKPQHSPEQPGPMQKKTGMRSRAQARDGRKEELQGRPQRSRKAPKKFSDFTQGQGLDAVAPFSGASDVASLGCKSPQKGWAAQSHASALQFLVQCCKSARHQGCRGLGKYAPCLHPARPAVNLRSAEMIKNWSDAPLHCCRSPRKSRGAADADHETADVPQPAAPPAIIPQSTVVQPMIPAAEVIAMLMQQSHCTCNTDMLLLSSRLRQR